MLPTTTYLGVLGYLLDESIQRVTTDVLNLVDITEVESNRLNDLLKLIRPLEEIFRMDPEQVSNDNTSVFALALTRQSHRPLLRTYPTGSSSAIRPNCCKQIWSTFCTFTTTGP